MLVAGPSGAGKSTLLRAIAGLLLTNDVGDLSGRVSIDGRAPQEVPGQVGLLLQDPSAATVATRVGRDVAFGLENIRVPRPQIPQRVRRALDAAQFPYDELRATGSLSGGESQRLALAGALALTPRVLLLDEPTAMLDESSAERVRRSVLDAAAEDGTTLLVVEHHISPWVEHMDRCVVLDSDGSVIADGPPSKVLADRAESLAAQGIWVPGLPAPEPIDIDPALVAPAMELTQGTSLVEAAGLEVHYRSALGGRAGEVEPPALEGVSCRLPAGTMTAFTGRSGAGKSTLLAVLAGLLKPDRGTADVHERLAGRKGRAIWRLSSRELARGFAWVPQLPEHGLVRHTVLEELMVTSRALGRPEAQSRARCLGLLEVLGLAHLANVSGHRLSGGEQRRLVVAAALAHGPSGLLLDEPTVGQDRNTWAAVLGACEAARAAGAGVAFASHDLDVVDHIVSTEAGRTVVLEGGRLAEGAS